MAEKSNAKIKNVRKVLTKAKKVHAYKVLIIEESDSRILYVSKLHEGKVLGHRCI